MFILKIPSLRFLSHWRLKIPLCTITNPDYPLIFNFHRHSGKATAHLLGPKGVHITKSLLAATGLVGNTEQDLDDVW